MSKNTRKRHNYYRISLQEYMYVTELLPIYHSFKMQSQSEMEDLTNFEQNNQHSLHLIKS